MPDVTPELVTIAIGVVTLFVGVVSSIKTSKQTVRAQNLQIILAVSDSFREKWEGGWGDVLDDLAVDHLEARTDVLPARHAKQVGYMLNWVDWLGAMKASDALEELDILTSSIGAPIKRIIHAGCPILRRDARRYGADYWGNLRIVAEHLGVGSACEPQPEHAGGSTTGETSSS